MVVPLEGSVLLEGNDGVEIASQPRDRWSGAGRTRLSPRRERGRRLQDALGLVQVAGPEPAGLGLLDIRPVHLGSQGDGGVEGLDGPGVVPNLLPVLADQGRELGVSGVELEGALETLDPLLEAALPAPDERGGGEDVGIAGQTPGPPRGTSRGRLRSPARRSSGRSRSRRAPAAIRDREPGPDRRRAGPPGAGRRSCRSPGGSRRSGRGPGRPRRGRSPGRARRPAGSSRWPLV